MAFFSRRMHGCRADFSRPAQPGGLKPAPHYSPLAFWRRMGGRFSMVTRSSTSYGHGVKWGNGVGDWDDKTLYQPEPYAGYLVREVEIGFASGDTVRTFNGVVTGY